MFNAMEGAEHLTNAFHKGMQDLIAGIEERKAFERLDYQRQINAYYQYGLAKEQHVHELLTVIQDYIHNHNARWDQIEKKEEELVRMGNEVNRKIRVYNDAIENGNNVASELRRHLQSAEEKIDRLNEMLLRKSVDKIAMLQMLDTMTLIANYYSALNGQNISPPEHMLKAINDYYEDFQKAGKVPKNNYIILLSNHIKAQNLKEKTEMLVKENERLAALKNQDGKGSVA